MQRKIENFRRKWPTKKFKTGKKLRKENGWRKWAVDLE